MGITSLDIELLDEILIRYKHKNVIELGAQQLYNQPNLPAPYANEYFEPKGVKYDCIDLSKENNCIEIDLSKPINEDMNYLKNSFDLVTNFGTMEHLSENGKFSFEAVYNCIKTMHDLTKIGGVIINENPKTGHWQLHGFSYYTKTFYECLVEKCGYKILKLDEWAAMGNYETGMNVLCVLEKVSNDFITFEDFCKLDLRSS